MPDYIPRFKERKGGTSLPFPVQQQVLGRCYASPEQTMLLLSISFPLPILMPYLS